MKWFAFHKGQLLLERCGDGQLSVPRGELPPAEVPPGRTVHTVTMNSGERLKTFSLNAPPPQGSSWVLVDLRQSYHHLPEADYAAAGKAAQILHWDAHSRYCPACGTPTVQMEPTMKRCPNCSLELYPPIATAIIVLIQRGDEILLVRSRNFRGTFHGLVAGFLEAGESLEECVRREVMEETGLTIEDLRYFGSQPWPFPSGLMVGFTARYAGGSIRLQESELKTAGFYRRDNLPEIPQKMSIARRLIDWWCGQQKQEEVGQGT